MNKCFNCNTDCDSGLVTDDGEYICDDCYDTLCESCHRYESEVEVMDSYVCSSCYGSMIDRAMDNHEYD